MAGDKGSLGGACNSILSVGAEEFIVTILATFAVCLKFFIMKIKKKKISSGTRF